ncbi:MAG: rhodanese-like domain-containing protein [Cellvibrionaceae bacterium]|nr:rhodanese-like domain-containing protein [Cellvibrionaceae bacterium]
MLFISEQWLLITILCASVSALIIVEGQRSGKSLSYHAVTHMLNNNLAILLDVRDAKEFSSGHIVDAINIPYAKLSERCDELKKHAEKTIIIVDKMGQHAGAAGKQLKQNGYQVNRLQGGMSEWTSQNLPVVKS